MVKSSIFSHVKSFSLILITLGASNVFAYTSTTTGESFSTNKTDACNKALDQARELAAQQARVYVSSKYERRMRLLSGKVVDNVTHQTYQSTFGIAELEEIVTKTSRYDEKTGSITCHVEARFKVDTEAVDKELEARISSEEAKNKEANRKTELLTILKNNENSYKGIKDKVRQYRKEIYAGSVICKESHSVSNCKNELIEKFENEKAAEIARDLDISNKYVSVIFDDFKGEERHTALEKYDDAFVITMTGEFNYRANIRDPYVEENNKIINELALINGQKTGGDFNTFGSTSALGESDSFLSSLEFEIGVVRGDLIGFDEQINEGESEAYIHSLFQLGVIFDAGDEHNKNLFKISLYSGDVNIHTCLSGLLSDKCDSLSTINTDVKGIGLEKIVEGASSYINFGGVLFRVEDKDIVETDFIQIKFGISNKGPGPYIYADISSLLPISKTVYRDIVPSIDLTLGVGVRF